MKIMEIILLITATLNLSLAILQIYKSRLEIQKAKIEAIKEQGAGKEKAIVVLVGLDEIRVHGRSTEFWTELEQRSKHGHFHGYMDPVSALLVNFLSFLDPASVVEKMIFSASVVRKLNFFVFFIVISILSMGASFASLIINHLAIESVTLKTTIVFGAMMISFIVTLFISRTADKFASKRMMKSK